MSTFRARRLPLSSSNARRAWALAMAARLDPVRQRRAIPADPSMFATPDTNGSPTPPAQIPAIARPVPLRPRSRTGLPRRCCATFVDLRAISRDAAMPAASTSASTARSIVALCIGRPDGDAGKTRLPASSERRRSASHASRMADAKGASRVRRVSMGLADSIVTHGEPAFTQLTVSEAASPVFSPPPRNTAINARSRRSLQRCAADKAGNGANS